MQGEATIKQGRAMAGGITQINAGLTMVGLATGSTPLAGEAEGVSALLGNIAAIDDEDAVIFTHGLLDEGLMGSQDGTVIPGTLTDELLEGAAGAGSLMPCTEQPQGHRFHVFARQIGEE